MFFFLQDLNFGIIFFELCENDLSTSSLEQKIKYPHLHDVSWVKKSDMGNES